MLQTPPSLLMKSFQHLTTLIALTFLASHQAVAVPTPNNQARSDSQSMALPIEYDNVVSGTGPDGNQITVISGSPSNAVVISNGKVQELNSADSQKLATSITDNVNNEVSNALAQGQNLASSIIKNVDNQITESFANSGL